jgi:hypothetical protein
MNTNEAVRRLTEVVRRQHLALATERTYCAWLRRYCDFLKRLPLQLPSEHKLERFLTALAQKDVAASTQNQAFNAIIFFYKEALGTELKNVQALRARRPAHIRHAPTPEETWHLLKIVQSDAAFERVSPGKMSLLKLSGPAQAGETPSKVQPPKDLMRKGGVDGRRCVPIGSHERLSCSSATALPMATASSLYPVGTWKDNPVDQQ